MQTLSKSTYSEQVVALIKQRIRMGKLHGGERISEAAIAEECGISRAPVRDALYILEAMGLLMSHPKRGKIVTPLTAEDIHNRYELAGLLEGAAAVSAVAAMTDKHFQELQEILALMHAAVARSGKIEEHADLGTRFHESILAHASNPLIASLGRKACRTISKYLLFQCWKTLYTPAELYDRHLIIYNALLTRESTCIEKAMRSHYAESGNRMTQMGRDRLISHESKKTRKRVPTIPTE